MFYLLSAIGFTACDELDTEGDDMIWDFAPIVLYISVQDADGNDLLNPETPGNIANQGIKAIYKDNIYEKDAPINSTRAYLARFMGLQTIKREPAALPTSDGQYAVTDVRYGIDVDNATEIEADLQQHLSHPIGSSYILHMDNKISFEGDKGRLTWKNADEDLTAHYQAMFPDSNVKGVTRVLISEYSK